MLGGDTSTLPGIPGSVRDGQSGGRARWTAGKGRKRRFYEWDSENGRVEEYDSKGKYLGERDPMTGEVTKEPKGKTKNRKPGRR